jgi:hypothetical protein
MPETKDQVASYAKSVFLNCPFDNDYKPVFEALIFAVFDCGYRPRCALEIDDAGQVRIEKIVDIIRHCRLGVHDISRTELDAENQLPRFNMPFELGVFVGATRFGTGEQKRKICVILDRERYRFQKFVSDIAGQDIANHGGDPEEAIKELRKWLSALPAQATLPGGAAIVKRYRLFSSDLADILAKLEIERNEMTYSDYVNFVGTWLADQPRTAR